MGEEYNATERVLTWKSDR